MNKVSNYRPIHRDFLFGNFSFDDEQDLPPPLTLLACLPVLSFISPLIFSSSLDEIARAIVLQRHLLYLLGLLVEQPVQQRRLVQ